MLSSIRNQGSLPVPSSQESSVTGQFSQEVDQKESATAAKFGDVYKQIQAKYGQKAEKPREAKKTLGKDDFLRIMISQMKNQDPTNPFKAEQMATQVAQFTSVEQLQNVNQNINKLGAQNKPLEQMVMTNMIGKTVTIDRERFPHTEGENESLNFNLPRPAVSARVSVMNAAGEEVFHKELGKQSAGEVSLIWDGLKNNSLPSKSGDYTLKIEAKDERGQNISMNPQAQSKVIGVSFEGLEPVLLVGDAHHQEKITMRNIVRVDLEQSQMPSQKPNFVPFQSPLSAMPPVMAPQNQVVAAQPAVVNQDTEKGFPNGLKGGESQ